jgi:hypothetical protein
LGPAIQVAFTDRPPNHELNRKSSAWPAIRAILIWFAYIGFDDLVDGFSELLVFGQAAADGCGIQPGQRRDSPDRRAVISPAMI